MSRLLHTNVMGTDPVYDCMSDLLNIGARIGEHEKTQIAEDISNMLKFEKILSEMDYLLKKAFLMISFNGEEPFYNYDVPFRGESCYKIPNDVLGKINDYQQKVDKYYLIIKENLVKLFELEDVGEILEIAKKNVNDAFSNWHKDNTYWTRLRILDGDGCYCTVLNLHLQEACDSLDDEYDIIMNNAVKISTETLGKSGISLIEKDNSLEFINNINRKISNSENIYECVNSMPEHIKNKIIGERDLGKEFYSLAMKFSYLIAFERMLARIDTLMNDVVITFNDEPTHYSRVKIHEPTYSKIPDDILKEVENYQQKSVKYYKIIKENLLRLFDVEDVYKIITKVTETTNEQVSRFYTYNINWTDHIRRTGKGWETIRTINLNLKEAWDNLDTRYDRVMNHAMKISAETLCRTGITLVGKFSSKY